MSISIRGGTPATASFSGLTDPSVTLTGTRQPQTGDVLIIVHSNNFYALSNMSTPTVGGSTTGVGTIGDADGGTNAGHIRVWQYDVTSTGDVTVASVETGSHDEEKILAVYVLSGVDTTTTIDGLVVASNGTGSTSAVVTGVTTSFTDSYLITHINSNGSANIGAVTPPGSMIESYDVDVASIMDGEGATQQLVGSGATGTRTFTLTNPQAWIAIAFAVKTASGATEPTGGPQKPFNGIHPLLFRMLAARNQAQWQNAPVVNIDVVNADTSIGIRLGESPATVSIDIFASDTPSAIRLGESPGTAGPSTVVTDIPTGIRLGQSVATTTIDVLTTDTPSGIRLGASPTTTTIDVVTADIPSGIRLGQSPGSAGSTTFVVDSPTGIRLGTSPATVTTDQIVTDTPSGIRLYESTPIVKYDLLTTDVPTGIRLGQSPATGGPGTAVADVPSAIRLGNSPGTVTIGTFAPAKLVESSSGGRTYDVATTTTGYRETTIRGGNTDTTTGTSGYQETRIRGGNVDL